MGGGAQHGMRKALRAPLIGMVKRRNAHLRLGRMAPDLVEREHSIVLVESGVLQALRHHRSCVLLDSRGPADHRSAAESAFGFGNEVACQQSVEKVEYARIDRAVLPSRL